MIGNIVSLVALTLVYWFCAVMIIFVGAGLFGDCDPASTCAADKAHALETGLAVSAVLYFLMIVPLAVALFRRR